MMTKASHTLQIFIFTLQVARQEEISELYFSILWEIDLETVLHNDN